MESAAIDIGSRIQRAREQRNLTRRDICEETKLSPMAVAAIEENKFGQLPGGMFRVAYIRTVAAAVGLDPEELAGAYRAAFEAEIPPAPPARLRASVARRAP